jgi:hypothetical protein
LLLERQALGCTIALLLGALLVFALMYTAILDSLPSP